MMHGPINLKYQILYLSVERSKFNLRTYRMWCVVVFVYELSATGSVCVCVCVCVCGHGLSRYLLTRNTHRTGLDQWSIGNQIKCFMQRIGYSITRHNFLKPEFSPFTTKTDSVMFRDSVHTAQ